MEQKGFVIILVSLVLIAFALLFYCIGYERGYDNGYMFYVPDNITHIEGFYDHSGYYCVITKNKDMDDIISIDEHEKCHILVTEDPEHFCK